VLGYEWAVIRFKKMEGENVPPAPKIEKLAPQERRKFVPKTPTQSVNELLAEMRFGKEAQDATNDAAETKDADSGKNAKEISDG